MTDRVRVQIFGLDKDQATRAAVRFFKERRVAIHQVDLKRKPIAPGELRRFVERLGAAALLDTEGRAYRDAGLALPPDGRRARSSSGSSPIRACSACRWSASANDVSAGRDEATWKSWLSGGSPERPTR